jgi:NAD(P)H-dependent FMN reductase
MKPKLHIIIGSTRPGRVGPSIAKWFHSFAIEHTKFDPVLVDLADFKLPIFDEPNHPAMQKYEHEHTKVWAVSVAAADALVFVTPEYNFGPPPALVNALDYLVREWAYLPAGVVSYGGISGGLRSAQMLKQTLTSLKMMPMVEAVVVPNFFQHIDEGGHFVPIDAHAQGARDMLNELLRWTTALTTLRLSAKG